MKWSFLRRDSEFEEKVKGKKTFSEQIARFPELEAIFGKKWLEAQKESSFFPFLRQRLSELDVAIRELKHLPGFDDWKNNIESNPREFESYEFEILEISTLADLIDSLEIYPPIGKGDPSLSPLSELKAIKNSTEFYVEMTKLRSMVKPRNKIEKLIKKARRQIPNDSVGFIFADVSDITLTEDIRLEGKELICRVVSNRGVLSKEVDQFFRGKNTRILGVVFIEHYLVSDEEYRIKIRKNYETKLNPFNKLGSNLREVGNLIFPDEGK